VPKNLANFIDDVHYTEAGSSLLAELVAVRIADSGMIAQKQQLERTSQRDL
jgi:hypothetical protein